MSTKPRLPGRFGTPARGFVYRDNTTGVAPGCGGESFVPSRGQDHPRRRDLLRPAPSDLGSRVGVSSVAEAIKIAVQGSTRGLSRSISLVGARMTNHSAGEAVD